MMKGTFREQRSGILVKRVCCFRGYVGQCDVLFWRVCWSRGCVRCEYVFVLVKCEVKVCWSVGCAVLEGMLVSMMCCLGGYVGHEGVLILIKIKMCMARG